MVLMIVQIRVKLCIVEMESKIIERNVIQKILQKHDGDQMDVISSVAIVSFLLPEDVSEVVTSKML